MHPIQKASKLHNKINSRKIKYKEHFQEDILPNRNNIDRKMIKNYIKSDFDELIDFSYKKDPYKNERYNLIFDKSSKYYLLIALSFANGHINIITGFVTRKHRGKPSELVKRWG